MKIQKECLSDAVTLYCGDCAEVLELIPPVDALVTDPRYGIGDKMGKNRKNDSGHWKAELYADMADWDKAPPPAELLERARAKAEFAIIWGGNYFELPPSRCWLVWHKTNNMPTTADCELAWTNMDANVKAFDFSCNGWDREHPTQKPVALMVWCLERLPPGARRVLDPFMGSGTTGVACVEAGRRFYGIEREQKYFDYARRRIEAALAAPRLFQNAPQAIGGTAEAAQGGLEFPAAMVAGWSAAAGHASPFWGLPLLWGAPRSDGSGLAPIAARFSGLALLAAPRGDGSALAPRATRFSGLPLFAGARAPP